MNKKIAAILADTARWIYGIVIACMLMLVLLVYPVMDFAFKTEFTYPGIVSALAGLLLFILIYTLIFYAPEKVKRYMAAHGNLFIAGATAVFFALLVFMTSQYYFCTGWDTGVLLDLSRELSETAPVAGKGIENVYLSRYPNNLLLTFIYKTMWQMGMSLFQMIILTCLISALTGLLCFKTAYLWKRSYKAAWMVWILYVLFVGVSPWVSIPYSDSMALIFPVLILYLYFQIRSRKHTGLKSALLMMAVAFGYHLKPQVIIAMIAVGIVILLNTIKKGIQIKNIQWKNIVCGLCGLLVMEIAVSGAIASLHIDLDEESAFTPEHYIMMGLNSGTQGGYLQKDVEFTVQAKKENGEISKDRGRKKDLEMAAERIKAYGMTGMIGHTVRKALNLYADGTMAWGKEGNFYMAVLPEPDDNIAPAIRSFYYDHGENNQLFKDYSQMIWLAVLTGTFFFFVFRKKEWKEEEMAVMLSILGITLFHMIFEVRARYLYIYLPVYILAAFGGIEQIWQHTVGKMKKEKNKKS